MLYLANAQSIGRLPLLNAVASELVDESQIWKKKIRVAAPKIHYFGAASFTKTLYRVSKSVCARLFPS